MKPRISYILIAAVLLCSCSDSSEDQNVSATVDTAAASSDSIAETSNEYDRKSFVLCPALENHRDELATIIGFEQDASNLIAMSERSSKCRISGKKEGYINVNLVPAMIKSTELHATKSFEGTASRAPEVGDDAMYVEKISQPHVIFSMGPILIDVFAENYGNTPDRNTMVSLATRVQEILTEAN